MRRNEHDAQLGHLDASFLPGEAQTWKPKFLSTEGQAQQQSVNQQREQQRRSHSPSLRAHALDPRLPVRFGLRRLLGRRIRWRCQRGVGTLARSTLPSPLRRQARQPLRPWRCHFMLAGTNFKRRGRRPRCRLRRRVDACTPQLRQTSSSFFDRVQRRFLRLVRSSIPTSPTHHT